MLDQAMPGPLFTAILTMHVVAGIVATLAIFPAMVFGPKTARVHRRLAPAAIAVSWIILIAGALLLLDPLFLVYWQQHAASFSTMRHHYVRVFQNAQEAWLFFVYLDVIFAYLVFTGMGVWKRVRRGNQRDGFPPRRTDMALAVAAQVLSAYMAVLALSTYERNPVYARMLLFAAAATTVFFIVDVHTWRDRGRAVRSWWAVHAWRLACAWVALAFAVLLRWRVRSTALDAVTPEVLLVLLAACAVAIGAYSHRLHGTGRLDRLLKQERGGARDLGRPARGPAR